MLHGILADNNGREAQVERSNNEERRHSARTSARRRVWVTDESGGLQEACTEDLSVAGLRIRAGGRLQSGTQVDVELFPADGAAESPLAPLAAHVRWTEELPPGGCRAGLEFEHVGSPATPPFSLPLPAAETPDNRPEPPPARRKRRKAAAGLVALLVLLLLLLGRREASEPRAAPGPGANARTNIALLQNVEDPANGSDGDAAGPASQAARPVSAPPYATTTATHTAGTPDMAAAAPGESRSETARPLAQTLAALGGATPDAFDLEDALARMVDALVLETQPADDAVPGRLRILIESGAYRLTVFDGDRALVSMPVGLGEDGATPPGDYYIANKITDPTWYNRGDPVAPGDPGNPLGRRWMGLGRDGAATPLGMHPTDETHSIGQPMSQGCVRLLPEDAESLFRLCPIDTPVHIVP